MSKYAMQKDVDIMGVQRGAHQDGEDICPRFLFKVCAKKKIPMPMAPFLKLHARSDLCAHTHKIRRNREG